MRQLQCRSQPESLLTPPATVYPYGMCFAVFPMRSHGRPLSRAELANRSPWIGDLRIEELRDQQLMRYVRMARILVLDRPRATEVLGELYEPQIVAMSPQAFTLSGYERVRDHCYAELARARSAGSCAKWQIPGQSLVPAGDCVRLGAAMFRTIAAGSPVAL
jgi:hypothetical protein